MGETEIEFAPRTPRRLPPPVIGSLAGPGGPHCQRPCLPCRPHHEPPPTQTPEAGSEVQSARLHPRCPGRPPPTDARQQDRPAGPPPYTPNAPATLCGAAGVVVEELSELVLEPTLSVWGCLGRWEALEGSWGCVGLLGLAWAFLGLPGAVWGWLGVSGFVWGCLGLFGAAWGCLGLYEAVWGCLGFLGLLGAAWGCLGLLGSVWACLGLLGPAWGGPGLLGAAWGG